MSREIFDGAIVVVIVIGLVWAALRLRADLTRPLPDELDTRPNPIIRD